MQLGANFSVQESNFARYVSSDGLVKISQLFESDFSSYIGLADWRTSPGSGGPSQSVLRGGK